MKREIKDYAFIDREGIPMTRERHLREMQEYAKNKEGTAYAFFDCDAAKAEIQGAMPEIRAKARTHEGLKLLLNEGNQGLDDLLVKLHSLELINDNFLEMLRYPDDYRVMSSERRRAGDITVEARPLGSLRYAMVANYRGASNEKTANELANVMNGVYGNLNRDKDWFRGAVVYQADDGEWKLHGE